MSDETGDGAALVGDRARAATAAVRAQAAVAWDALGVGPDVEGQIHAHVVRTLWRLLGPHVRDQGRLWRATRPGATSDVTGNPAFATYLEEDGWAALRARLPRLEPLVTGIVDREVAAAAEVLDRAARDAPALAAHFGDGTPLGPLTAVALGLSDPHHGRRTVAALTFAGGPRVICKPRSVALEAGLGATLGWLCEYGPLDLPGGPATLERDGYGWCRFVESRACVSREEVDAHFWRLGALAAVLAALGMTDGHADNFVAAGPNPVLIDAETLLHPRLLASPGFTLRETEIVPGHVVGPAGQRIDYPGYDASPDAPNLPRRDGRPQYLRDHGAPFADGVAEARRVLAARGAALTAPDGPLTALAGRRARVVLRPTELYGRLLLHLASAPALRTQDGGLARIDLALSRYRDPVLSDDAWATVQRAELAALAAGDVPYLVADTTTGDLHDADGSLLAARALEPVLPALLTCRTRPG